MKEKTLTVDDKTVVIRPMDKSYIIDACAHDRVKGISYPAFQRFHRDLMERYGNSAILAWCESKVVGFVNFYPMNVVSPAPLCPGVEAELEEKYDLAVWPEVPSKTLGVGCVNVSEGFHRQGIGTSLVAMLIDWAKEHGYASIIADANDRAWWKPCRPFWEQLGFHVKEIETFDKPREDGDRCVCIMEMLLSQKDDE